MNNERGFTLAEMMVVCAIVGLVMASLLGLVMSGQQAYWYGTTQVDAQQNARVAIERIMKDIREAGYYPQNPDTAPATCTAVPCYTFNAVGTGLSSSSLVLQYDWNGDGAVASGAVNDPVLCATGAACRGERVTYSFASGAVTRQEPGVNGGAAETLASGISSMSFGYLAEDGTTTTAAAAVRTVTVTVTAQTATNGAFVTMTDRVRLRNR